MSWLDKLRGRGRAGDGGPRLVDLIDAYPPYRPAVTGAPATLSEADAARNLAKLMEDAPGRLAGLSDLLSRFGVDTAPALDPARDPRPTLDALWRWTKAEWPALRDPALLDVFVWLEGRRDRPVFGLITDVGLLLGETVARRRPDYAWVVDLDPDNREMPSWRRPCLVRPSDGISPRLLYDPESAAHGAYVNCATAFYALLDDLTQGALDTVEGAPERWWREQAETSGRSVLPDLEPDHVRDEPD